MHAKWQQFLTDNGAKFIDGKLNTIRDDNLLTEINLFKQQAHCLSDLSHYCVLRITGQDATQFLQNQLTCDVLALTGDQALPGAWCSRKGRMMLNLTIWRDTDYYILLPRAMLDIFKQQWKKYALFSKVNYDITDKLVIGLSGHSALDIFSRKTVPNGYALANEQDDYWIRLRDQQPMYYWVTDEEKAINQWPSFSNQFPPVGSNVWQWAMIEANLVDIFPQISDKLLPQMIKLEQHNGVSFTKGCYLGQEVIARTQHLGKLKRCIQAVTLTQTIPPKIGEQLADGLLEINSPLVVAAAQVAENQYRLLVVGHQG